MIDTLIDVAQSVSIGLVAGATFIAARSSRRSSGNLHDRINRITTPAKSEDVPRPICHCGGDWGNWELIESATLVEDIALIRGYVDKLTKFRRGDAQARTCKACGYTDIWKLRYH